MEEGQHREFAGLAGTPGRAASRAVVMLGRGRTMAAPWALWGEMSKIRVTGFLADGSLAQTRLTEPLGRRL